ncbi:hypothetical protein HPB47_017086 [Ixodes persulcatus]|uniref:Uncharacterized protein n=1 Tax=Ixodes persulcatus TaxID=34615 RepID=A0AC60QP77_IXOPE|nr:hypothetical protein HPB47_017086 [Ixodes persulcatus]
MQVSVEGTDITPEELEAGGWFPKQTRRQQAKEKRLEAPATRSSATRPHNGAAKATSQRMKRPPPPPLPKGEHKIVVRPRGGFNTASWSDIQILDGARSSIPADLPSARELLRKYPEQNIFVICTPNSERAEAYSKMQAINIAGKTYPATAYTTTPENTCKGIIHDIQEEGTPETIWDSLQYNTNPPILQFRRLGKSGPLLLLYEGQRVPHWVDYRGATLRCLLYKKRVEVCKICARVGHREDICPTPNDKKCFTCGTIVSDNANHECTPHCAICGGGHESGSKRCRQRFLPARKPRAPFLPTLDPTDEATFPAMGPSTCGNRSTGPRDRSAGARGELHSSLPLPLQIPITFSFPRKRPELQQGS